MPKRAKIIRQIAKAAKSAGLVFEVKREGANHTIFSLDGVMIALGRHNEFGDRYAQMIYRQCEPKLGKGWWR
ncbi:hypothetical protein [Mycobacterium sp. UM_WGJ]|uniref:hypothetical protein n=1 Tax=Mycobacterium sp. UM_WGJ TaxID=1370120 RepID=UPI000463A185|nr:hypothetical protein [Mycobacterium sp. UM_WGJ]